MDVNTSIVPAFQRAAQRGVGEKLYLKFDGRGGVQATYLANHAA